MKPKLHINYALEYPRKKNYLNNLNILLDTVPVKLPQKVLSNTFFPARKLSTSQSMTRIKHFRVHSSQLSKRKELQHEQFRSTVFGSLKKTCEQRMTSSQLGDLSSLQTMRSRSMQLRMAVPIQRQAYQSAKLDPQKRFTDLELYKPKEAVYLFQQSNSYSNRAEDYDKGVDNTNPNRRPKKQFLRKGSSINKQIVVNLLKLKLIKEREDQQNGRKEFENEEIIKMIKLYKGQLKPDPQSLQNKQRNLAIRSSLRKPESRMHRLTGWQNQHQGTEFI